MSDIFKYRNLTDFEKVLFLEKHVKELLQIAKDRGVEIGKLKAELDEAKYEQEDSTKVKNLRNQLEQERLGNDRKKRKVLYWRAMYEALRSGKDFEIVHNNLITNYENRSGINSRRKG